MTLTIISTVLIIILCSSVYILRENIEFQSQTITYINLVIAGIMAIMIYNSTKKHYIRWSYLICILSVFFVFNRYYDETVFWNTFRFKLFYFLIIIGIVIAVCILSPLFKDCFKWISCLLEEWTKNRLEEEKRKKQKAKYIQYKEKHIEKKKSDKNANEVEQKINNAEYKNRIKKRISLKKDVILFGLVFSVLLFIPICLLLFSVYEQSSNILERITYNNISTAVLSLAVTVVFLIFVTGIMVSLIVKWYQIIKDIIFERHKGEMYFVYACGLFFVSQYVFSNYSYTTDDIADLLLSGKIFTFPLVLSILVPIFLIFAENIVAFTSKNPEIKDKLKKSANRTIDIANGIIDSLLTFIQFVTSDYLSTIIELSDEDNSSNANLNKEGDENNIG